MSMRFLTLDVGGTYAVTPSCVNNPEDFTCQLVAHYNQINDLTRELSKLHEFIPADEGNLPQEFLHPGSVGCVKSKDGRWYRAVLTSTLQNSHMIQVKLLDYGTIENTHISNVKQIGSQEYVDLPIQGLNFKLWNVKPTGASWSDSEIDFFRKEVQGKEFVVKVVNVTSPRHFEVTMLGCDRLEINRHFRGTLSPLQPNAGISPPPGVMQGPPMTNNPHRITRGQALVSNLSQRSPPISNNLPHVNQIVLKNQFLKVGSAVVITVTAVHDFLDVVCHVTQNLQALNALMRDIAKFYSSLLPNDLALGSVVPGLVCCARFTIDNNWYRAEIISVQSQGIEVEYVDYGIREVLPISRLKTINTAFTILPKQGIHCSLVDAGQSVNFPQGSLQKLQKHVNKNFSAQVLKEIKPGKYSIILFDNIGQNILSRFMNVSGTTDVGQTIAAPSIRVGQQFPVEITNVVSVSKFSCQLKSTSEELNTLMDKIHNYYTTNSSTMSLRQTSKGMICCCQFSEDDGWYRAQVISLSGGEAEVKYIDYGNTEKLPLNRIKDLQPEFMTLPMQSVDCCLDVSLSDSQVEKSVFEMLTMEKTLSAILLQEEADSRFRIKLFDGNTDIGLELSKSNISVSQDQQRPLKTNPQSKQPSKFFFPKSTLEFGVEQNVYVTHVENPECFYVQLSDLSSEMDTMVDAIHNYYSKLGPNDEDCNPELGMSCVAKYTVDNGWYRATVTGLYHNGDVQVLFVDYGNVEVLKRSALKELHKDFKLLPSQGIKCALMGIHSGTEEWSADITYGFEELVLNKELSINALQYDNDANLYHVQLFDSDRCNLSVKLLKVAGSGSAGVTTNPYDVITFTQGQYENVMISHSDDPGNFWCHIAEKIPEIDALMDDLFEAYDSDNIQILGSKAKAGMSCCAKYSDGSWYRAKILKIKGQEAAIQYVDYGNTSDTEINELKPLLPNFANLPEQAIACSLVGIAPIGTTWSVESCTAFNEMVIEKKLVLHVISQEESGRSLVELVNTREDCVINDNLVSKGLVKSTKSSYSSKSSRSSSRMSSRGLPVNRINSQDNLSNSSSTTSLPSLAVTSFKDASYRPGSKLAVYISHAVSPAEFWCQSVETSGLLEEIMNGIDQYYSKLGRTEQSLDITTVGTPCIAKYKADDGWYRGIVINKHMGSLDINFVDYGNTERVSVTDVKQILPEFLNLPIQGLKCVLKGMESNGASPKMKKMFSDIASGIEEFNCSIVTESSGVYEVDLEWNGKKMSSELASYENKKERSSSKSSDEVFGTPPRKQNQKSSMPSKDTFDGGSFSRPNKTNDGEHQESGRSGFGEKTSGFDSKPQKHPTISYIADSIRVGGSEDFLVSHIESPMQFWCQPLKSSADLDKLMELINETQHEPIGTVQPGSPCVAKFKDDDGWYRAVIKKQLSNSTVEIQFVDYGNSDTVSKSDLKMLTSAFANLPAQAIECRMKGLIEEAATLTDEFEALVTEKQLVASISRKRERVVEIQLTDTSDISIVNMLNSKAATKPMKFTPLDIKVSGKEDIYITSTDSGGVIFAQFGSQAHLLEEIQNKLQTYYASGSNDNLTDFNQNQLCCALFKEDGLWYRATVEGPGENDTVLVRYIDFGNVEVQKKSTLKCLIQGVANVPPLAVKCILNVENAKTWTAVNNQRFSEMVTDKLLQAEFLSDTKPYSVKLVLDGSSVAESFKTIVEETPEVDVPIKFKSSHLKTKMEVFVSHTVSIDQFWCQPASSADELAALMDSIHEVYSSLAEGERSVHEPTIGMPCIAKFIEDDGWYRATIISVSEEGINVMYVDYGNSAIVSNTDIKTISSNFIALPPQAVQCQLRGGKNWKEEAVEKFEEETTDKKLLVEVVNKKIFEGKVVSKVNLLDMGTSILQKLLEADLGEAVSDGDDDVEPLQYESSVNLVKVNELLEVYPSSIISVDDFNVQLNKTANDLAELMNTLYEIYSVDDVENASHSLGPCIAKYAEDGGWYRGEVTEVTEQSGLVFFIDYGNSEHVPWTDIKTTCIEATVLPAQAVKCRLALPEDMSNKEELSIKFQEAVADKLLIAEFISITDGIWTVKLTEDNRPLIDKLLKVKAPSTSTQIQEVAYKPLSLKEGDEKRVVITWSESPEDFWCQLESMVADLDALSEMIQAHYSALGDDAEVISDQKVGTLCVAPVEEEGVWYRSLITECSNDKATVQYVDYGNTGVLSKSKIKIIQNSFLSHPVFAFHCNLASILPKDGLWSAEASEAFEAVAFEGTLTASIKSISGVQCSVTLVDDNGVSLNQTLIDSGFAVKMSNNIQAQSTSEDYQYVKMPTPIDPQVEVQISHVETPQKFFVQLTSKAEELNQVATKVMDVSPAATPLTEAIVGDVCLAKYSLDEVWYRAVITGTEDSHIFVTFIDYGNTDALQLHGLKKMPSELQSIPAQALECTLHSVAPLEDSWEDAACIAFEEAVIEQLYDATFSGTSVELFTKEGNNLKDFLFEVGICKHSEVAPEEDTAALQDSVSVEEAGAVVEDEQLSEIASIAKLVVDEVIEGALTHLEDELRQYSDSIIPHREDLSSTVKSENLTVDDLSVTQDIIESKEPTDTTEKSADELSTENIIIGSQTVDQILDDIVEASLRQSNLIGTEEAESTEDVTHNVEDASESTEDVGSTDVDTNCNTVCQDDASSANVTLTKKAGSVTEEWEVIKTLEGAAKTDNLEDSKENKPHDKKRVARKPWKVKRNTTQSSCFVS
ncbi:tudor domain-containing protein 15-like isoform X2 [Antedon mediterranea]|uniref:tudor domain-containing protein 15-like isoform X2 n=1 Tax=Antedon mediterranea TaxID=105859 RepID=UPI003AF63622